MGEPDRPFEEVRTDDAPPPVAAAEPGADPIPLTAPIPVDVPPPPAQEPAVVQPVPPPLPVLPPHVPAWQPPAPTRPHVSPLVPGDFAPITLSKALECARETTVARVQEWLANPENESRLLFDAFRPEGCRDVAVVTDPAAVPGPLWIIGDVHADVLALANIVEYAYRMTPELGEPAFLFLGDFVDRGRFDHETLLLVFGLVMRNPGRVCVIPGNHDIDLRWGEKSQRFGVTIQPAEYCERLNRAADPEETALARLAIRFWEKRPRAVFLPDGTMFSHGGFPHTDLHDSLQTVADLGSKRCLDDFLWARLSESPKKRPNRGNRGHEFGWRDFSQFCRLMGERLRIPVRRLIRGHDHVAARWHLPEEYAEHPVLTINAMGWRMDSEPEPADGPHPFPVVARHVPDQLPVVVRLRLDPPEVDRAFAKPAPVEPQAEPTPAPHGRGTEPGVGGGG